MSPLFLLLATMIIAGALGAMVMRNPVHCALSLVVTFVGLAGFYLDLGAHFLGLAQIMVYVGAVAILLVFVMLLTRTGAREGLDDEVRRWRSGAAVALLVAVGLVGALWSGVTWTDRATLVDVPTVRDLGEALMADYVMPLQVVGVLLTAAMIGAAILALPERRRDRAPQTGRDV
jgi:NADH-quinone oxidoreductase subunit J